MKETIITFVSFCLACYTTDMSRSANLSRKDYQTEINVYFWYSTYVSKMLFPSKIHHLIPGMGNKIGMKWEMFSFRFDPCVSHRSQQMGPRAEKARCGDNQKTYSSKAKENFRCSQGKLKGWKKIRQVMMCASK